MTADPKVRYGEDENHTCFARWTMAVEDRSWKVDDTYHVDFIPCKAIGNMAAVVANTCYKGKELVVSGKMQSGSYEKDNKKHYFMEPYLTLGSAVILPCKISLFITSPSLFFHFLLLFPA